MKFLSTLLAVLAINALVAQEIELVPFASGFNSPLNIQNAGDDRLFIVEQPGIIRVVNSDGSVNATPFLDISGDISSGGERGLLGLAFHPDYSNNGFFYVYFTQPDGDTQVSRFSVDAGDPDVADAGSELFILEYSQPFSNHNGGCIAFGPDGYLYIASGDGGSAGDPNNNGQNTEVLLGKLLRIDVDNPGGGLNYGIPGDNPFAGSSTDAEEIWAYGLRNPWKFSFDSQTGDLWIADVGQNAIEEINHVESTEAGLNYGWRCYEGSSEFNTAGCPDPSELTFPIAEYPHSTGSSITGGYVYRGFSSFFNGKYFFADFVSGVIGYLDENDDINFLNDLPSQNWASFGEDINGELYLAGFNGTIYKFEPQVLSVDDQASLQLRIFPNPVKDRLSIESPNVSIIDIHVYNLQGKKVMQMETGEQTKLNISVEGWSQGLYILEIGFQDGRKSIEKLIVK